MVQIKFYDVLFYDMKQISRFRYKAIRCSGYLFFHTQRTWWRNFYFMIYIKSSKIVQKSSPPTAFYIKKLIFITTKYFMSASQLCKKILRKRAIKVRNREILQYSLTKFIVINLSNIFLLICIKLPLTGAKSKTLTCYI